MRKLLIVSPRFAPDSAADNQRVHLLLPFLAERGWQAHVAAVSCAGLDLPQDQALAAALAAHAEVRRSGTIPLARTRKFGIGSLALRSRSRLDRLVRDWHGEVGFDLVLVSHTEFGLWPLAARWRRDLGLPYVLDWQDPWYSDYYARHPRVRPPGGRMKFAVQQYLARRAEPIVATLAAQHICVSSYYVGLLRSRYPQIPAERFTVLPFPAPVATTTVAGQSRPSGDRYWAYAGRGGEDMHFALRALFLALADARRQAPARFADLRLRFVGTSYAPAGRALPSIQPLAAACGVGDLVDESPLRVSPEAVRDLLIGADALIVPGSDDPGYVPSKIQSLLALPKPMLAMFHAASDVHAELADQPGVVAMAFDPDASGAAEQLQAAIARRWLAHDPAHLAIAPRRLSAHSAEASAQRLATVLDRALTESRP